MSGAQPALALVANPFLSGRVSSFSGCSTFVGRCASGPRGLVGFELFAMSGFGDSGEAARCGGQVGSEGTEAVDR